VAQTNGCQAQQIRSEDLSHAKRWKEIVVSQIQNMKDIFFIYNLEGINMQKQPKKGGKK